MSSMTTYRRRRVDSNGVTLSVIDEGSGPPVLMLHGFPDSAHLWRNQIPALVDAGYRVIVPDLRGFGDSDKPSDVAAYRLRTILNDLVAITRACGVTRTHVVAHDFGAAAAWMYAALMPRRVDHLVALSVGHPERHLAPSLAQREKSWYMLLYQFPEVSEQLLRHNSWRLFKQMIGGEGDQARYISDLARPGALTAGLNWYRANNSPELELGMRVDLPPILAPTLAVWSTGDRAIVEETVAGSDRHVRGPWRYERIEGASHWIPLDAPDQLNKLLLEFLGSQQPATAAARPRRRL